MKYSIITDFECKEAPSAQKYKEMFEQDVDMVIVLTSSLRLSDSYSNAVEGRHLVISELKKMGLQRKNIFVLDVGSIVEIGNQLYAKALELCENNPDFSDICLKLMFFKNSMLAPVFA